MARSERPGWGRLAAYAAPSLPLAGFGLPLVVHLPTFYARDVGTPLAQVSLAFMLVRLVDIGFDPLLGWMMDRTRTRLGRFRPWLIGATPLLMLAAGMLFMPPRGAGPGYLWFWLVVGYLGFSLGSLSQTAWGAVLSPDYNERSRVYGWWQAGNVVGMLLILALPPLIETGFKRPHPAGIHAMGWAILLLTPLTVALACVTVGEPREAGPTGAPLRDYLALFRNRAIRNLLIADLLLGWAPAITGALFLFYFDQVKHVPEFRAGVLLLIYFVSGLLGAPLWTWLAVKVGKHQALALVCAAVIASLAVLLVTPVHSLALGAAVMVLGGLPFSGGALLLRAMLADVGDEIRLTTGVDQTGLLYSIFTGTRKVADMLGVGAFMVLAWLGFDPRAGANTGHAIVGLQLMFIGAPCLLSAMAGVIILRYPLDARRHAVIRAELERRGSIPE